MSTPPAVGPWCRQNFIPRRPNLGKNQTGLPNRNPKPPPADTPASRPSLWPQLSFVRLRSRPNLSGASWPQPEANPSLAWWRDRAFQRNPTSRAFATGPASRRAAKPPSHRADEPPSAQAPGIRAPLVRTDPKDRSRRAPRMRSQDSAVSRLSPPLIAHSLTRLAICSGQSHPGLQTQPQPVRHRLESHRSRALRPPGRYGRVRPVRDSPSDVATCHRVVPTGTHYPE